MDESYVCPHATILCLRRTIFLFIVVNIPLSNLANVIDFKAHFSSGFDNSSPVSLFQKLTKPCKGG